LILKYKKDLLNAQQDQKVDNYNEVLCYDYEIQEILVLNPKSPNVDDYKNYKKELNKVGYMVFNDIKKLQQRLKGYQKMAKEFK